MPIPTSHTDPNDTPALVRAFAELPIGHRTALVLALLERWSLGATAQRLRCGDAEVACLIRQGLQFLRQPSTNNSQCTTHEQNSAHSDADSRLDAIFVDYLRACDAGLTPDRTALLQQHEDLTSVLTDLFASLDRFLACAESLRTLDLSLPTQTLVGTTLSLPQAEAEPFRSSSPVSIAIPDFEIVRVLGEGGMGIVYLAWQISLPRHVAIKMIKANRVGKNARARFREEVNVIAQLKHSHIVQIHAVGEHEGEPFCVLEFAEGGTLADRLKSQPQPARTSAEWVRTLALTMQTVHQTSIIHLDLKPGNILFTEEGSLKITDFGLAQFMKDMSARMRPGAIAGTPSYMAPEQADGRVEDFGPVTDVYALGAILYEMLTGRPPFKEASQQQTMKMVRTAAPVPVRQLQPSVPRDLEAIVHKCLEKDPAQRYPTAEVLASRLQLFLDDEPIPERPRSWINKVARVIWKRPLLSSALLLLVLASISAWLVMDYLDPARTQKEMQKTLLSGETYTAKGKDPFRWILGDSVEPRPGSAGEGFFVDTHEMVLLALTDDPMCPSYEFSAEVRHDQHGGASQVGLYFGFQEQPLRDQARQAGFYTLAFADRGAYTHKLPDQTYLSEVSVQSRLADDAKPRLLVDGPVVAKGFVPAGVNVESSPWRTLKLTVHPERVKADWEPVPGNWEEIGIVKADHLNFMRKIQIQSTQRLKDFSNVPTDFTPRASLGLYVSKGKASFRNITLTPLPNGE